MRCASHRLASVGFPPVPRPILFPVNSQGSYEPAKWFSVSYTR